MDLIHCYSGKAIKEKLNWLLHDWLRPRTTDIRGFPKVDHSGRSARIVLEQINSAKKKLPLTGVEPSTLGLSVLLTSCLLSLMPYPVLDPIS